MLVDALDRLPDEPRPVLVLRHVVGLSPVEIADRMKKTESAIHGLHHRGRGALKGRAPPAPPWWATARRR